MEMKKTTLLSALVCVAGVLAEIAFQDIFTTSVVGIVLSVLLAIIILSAAYFALDGFYSLLKEGRGEDKKKQQGEYEQRIYTILNELLQFEKAIYKEVRALQQMSVEIKNAQNEIEIPTVEMPPEIGEISKIYEEVRALQQMSEEIKAAQDNMAVPMAAVPSEIEGITEKVKMLQQISEEIKAAQSDMAEAVSKPVLPPEPPEIPPIEIPPIEIPPIEVPPAEVSEETLDKLTTAINDNTTMAAKIIVKYVDRNTGDLKEFLEKKQAEMQKLLNKLH